MFEDVFKTLSDYGKKKQDEVDEKNAQSKREHQREIEEYKKKKWYIRIFCKNPENKRTPVVMLSDFYKKCLALDCQEGMRNFILIDAGGFTLDVVANIDNCVVLEKSYKIGGNHLTSMLLERMRKYPNYESTPESDAEREKIAACTWEDERAVFRRDVEELTKELYGPTLTTIADYISQKNYSGVKFVLVCSGLAAQNPYFYKMLKETLKNHKIVSEETRVQNTKTLFSFIENNKHLLSDEPKVFANFVRIAKRTNNMPLDSTFDISGGLFKDYIKEETNDSIK